MLSGLGGSTVRTRLDGGVYAVLTDLRLDVELHCWYVDFSDRYTVQCALKRYRKYRACARRRRSKENEDARKSGKNGGDVRSRDRSDRASPITQFTK